MYSKKEFLIRMGIVLSLIIPILIFGAWAIIILLILMFLAVGIYSGIQLFIQPSAKKRLEAVVWITMAILSIVGIIGNINNILRNAHF
jgi:hypothetical protein